MADAHTPAAAQAGARRPAARRRGETAQRLGVGGVSHVSNCMYLSWENVQNTGALGSKSNAEGWEYILLHALPVSLLEGERNPWPTLSCGVCCVLSGVLCGVCCVVCIVWCVLCGGLEGGTEEERKEWTCSKKSKNPTLRRWGMIRISSGLLR